MTVTVHPTLRSLTATAVSVPMRRPLGTSAQRIDTASLALVDLQTEEGITGRAYAFCYLPSIALALVPIVAELSATLAGAPVAPLELARRVGRHLKLPGITGPLAMVASAVDTAAWDAFAQAAGVPLAAVLGAQARPIPAYNSTGLGLMTADQARVEAVALTEGGFTAVKLRLGRPTAREDLAVVRAVRDALPDEVHLMVDFNQALSFAEGMRRCVMLDGEGVYWIEEPIRHDDYRHLALIAQATATPIQIGENFTGTAPMVAALEAGATDYVMPDLDRIGGVTGWQQAAGLAAAHDREVSSHLFPEVSAHLLCATPGGHWLEYVDWAEPVLEQPLEIADGLAIPSTEPGNGLRWDRAAVVHHRLG
ncbi:mandelate racemase [Baekduia soli]|uniref:Mandelate racemase n=1 Tax=Baekduia soli TaxID=496014 RepID=A0A5B8U5T3_9ACTN|nr:enolase C-terminal domain-like protein [Baekduia soli]QEC48198.1 mandelate racemase [Baekduia soli]